MKKSTIWKLEVEDQTGSDELDHYTEVFDSEEKAKHYLEERMAKFGYVKIEELDNESGWKLNPQKLKEFQNYWGWDEDDDVHMLTATITETTVK